MIENKNIQDKKYILGQFFTNMAICQNIVSNISFDLNDLIIEPSFGSGNFLKALSSVTNDIIGIEIDKDIYSDIFQKNSLKTYNMNFYDWSIITNKRLVFIGNPPYRTPAYSLSTHNKKVLSLSKKYNCAGVREEAIFFILYTIDIIKQNGGCGEIHYILPKSILKNNSKFYTLFKQTLIKECHIKNIQTIVGTEFDGVSQDLIYLYLTVGESTPSQIMVDNQTVDTLDYLCLTENYIPFQQIFKKTYLGSVPCESLLMSVYGETKEHFQKRLYDIISTPMLSADDLYHKLQYNGVCHLKVLNSDNINIVLSKLNIILSYVKNIQEKQILNEFADISNYKEIQGRNSVHYYFRCEGLKQHKNFVYELNPNPCKSFYFTGNPSSSSTDYFGFCNYDVNRNVSPGANRTIPVDNIEDNLTEEFKKYWKSNTTRPYTDVFEYLMHISKSSWYKQMKKENKRFYFGIPKIFDISFNG